MPWIEVRPMDAKVLFIADYLRKRTSFSGLCRDHGISRKTGYKWVKRYEESGFDGLADSVISDVHREATAFDIACVAVGCARNINTGGQKKFVK